MGVLFILLALLGTVNGATPRVKSTYPRHLNLFGGQNIYIHGSGFSKDQFNYFDDTVGNRVRLVNLLDSIDCDIINYLTNTEKIVCTIGAIKLDRGSGYKDYYLNLTVDGQQYKGNDHIFYFQENATPKLWRVYPTFGKIGELVKLDCNSFTNEVEHPYDNWESTSRRIQKAYMGGVQCELFNGTEPYGEINQWHITCLPLTQHIGPMNASVYVVGRGPSVTKNSGMHSDSQDRLYQYHTYAVVSDVSPQTSSSAGGALINVKGSGFNPEEGKTKVTVGGAPCNVKEISNDWLTCLTPPQNNTYSESGGMGLLFEIWEGVYFDDIDNDAKWENLTSSHENYKSEVITNIKYTINIPTPSVGRFSGYLKIPHEGEYNLIPFVGSKYNFYMALDGNPNNKRKMAFSERFEATPDVSPYIEIKISGRDNTYFNLLFRDFHTRYLHSSQTIHSYEEEQSVSIDPEEKYHTIRVTVQGAKSAAKLYLNGHSSKLVVDVADPVQVRDALLEMVGQQCQEEWGDDPDQLYTTGYEPGEKRLPGQSGRVISADAFCGRQVLVPEKKIFSKNRVPTVDGNKYNYICFALKGNIESYMELTVRFRKKSGATAWTYFTFDHGQNYNADRWLYHCYDAHQIIKNSWIKDEMWSKSLELYTIKIYPEYSVFGDQVYVDQFTFSDQNLMVKQTIPSALKYPNYIWISDIEVSGIQNGDNMTSYDLTFITSMCQTGIPLMAVYSTAVESSWHTSLETSKNETFVLDSGTSVTVTVTQEPTSPMNGTWDLTIQGRTLTGLDPFIPKETLEFNLNAAFGMEKGFIVTKSTINCGISKWWIKYLKHPGKLELPVVDISKIVFDGESVNHKEASTHEGNFAHNPITPDFLTTHSDTPQVVVSVNGYTAACEGSCDMAYDDSSAPSLTSIADSHDGTGTFTLTLTGSGFTVEDLSAYSVLVGGQMSQMSSVTKPTQVVCSVQLSAGTHVVSLSMQPIGATTNTLSYDVPLTLSAIDPATGGTGGGYQVTLTGEGFPKFPGAATRANEDYVKIGDNECQIITSNYNELKCVAPAGSDGSVDVEVMFGGMSASLSSFTYDAALSPTLESVNPTSLSLLGGEVLTMSGANLGIGDDCSVMVGESECVVQTCSESSITCTPPSLSPGTYPVIVTTSQGVASGSSSVTYLLKLTSSSPPQGSIKGGSLLVLKGQGFGTDCSLLKVQLGEEEECEVLECSDTSITCQVRLLPKTHVVTNGGSDSDALVSWEPPVVDIQEGDSVLWKWMPRSDTSKVKHNIFQIANAVSDVYDGHGFISGAQTATGVFMVRFPHATTIFYAGDLLSLDKIEPLVLKGVINVKKHSQRAYKVSLTLNGFEALYQPEKNPTGVSTSVSDCSDLVVEPLDGCNVAAPHPPDNDTTHLYHLAYTCFTPIITSVAASANENIPGLSGLTIRAGTTLTFTGSGFGTIPCQNQVSVGGSTCTVTDAAEDTLTCILDDLDNIVAVQPFPVEVIVWNRGQADVDVADYDSMGEVAFVPVVTSFSPMEGSVNGGTKITITGSGLRSANELATVMLDGTACVVESVTATSIVCISKAHGEEEVQVVVKVNQLPAIMETTDTFKYAEAASPVQSSITINESSVMIEGSNFGADASKVSVVLTPSISRRRRKRSLEREIQEENQKDDLNLLERRGSDEDIHIFERQKRNIDEDASEVTEEQLRVDLLGEVSSVWGQLTNTNAKDFRDTRRLGLWRIGGTGIRTENIVEQVNKRSIVDRMERSMYDGPITCNPTLVTDTQITCTAADIPPGSYEVLINIDGLGYANPSSLTSEPEVTIIDPTEGSINGGTLVTITGSAFDPSNVAVVIGDSVCDVVSSTTTSISCRTMSHAAATLPVKVTSGGSEKTSPTDYTYSDDKTPVLSSVMPTETSLGDTVTLTGANLNLSGTDSDVLVDGTACPVVAASATSVTCTAPDLSGGSHDIKVRDTMYGDSNVLTITYSLTINSVSPDTGGLGGTEVTITGQGFDPACKTTVTICGKVCVVPSSCTPTSSQITCIAPPMTTDGACDVKLSNPNGSTVSYSSFLYSSALTPVVTSLTKTRGGTAGGTTITITGTDFASSGNTVSIDGSPCLVSSESTSSITCVTEAHQGSGKFPVVVQAPGAGLSTTDENGEYFYIDVWSSIYTWGGEPVPSVGQLVSIEANQTILMDQTTEVLKFLLIDGGHVIFDDEATEEIILRAEYILIVGGGSLTIGTQDQPYQNDAVIELYGNKMSLELPHYGAKVLAVREGTLDIHGSYIPVTWTHLATTAEKGDTDITLKQPVTWKAGDTIVIATTQFKFGQNENEERRIASVSGDGRTLTLTEALKFQHISIEQNLGGRTIETRAEVGLLTRNVKIRGAINTDFTETIEACEEHFKPGQHNTLTCFRGAYGEEEGSDLFGAQVMIFGKEKDKDLVQARISYTEVTQAGQAFQLGRYPLHFHLVGNVSSSYVRGCAIHRTFNRAVTIHAADYLTVEYNVVYNNMGHAIFTEDGIERFNTIQYNLALFTRSSSSLLNVDVTPASYWVVHPTNIVQHNAAAGGTHFGYWYRLDNHPGGPSVTKTVCQNMEPMGTFKNNTAHSFGRYGLWVFSNAGYFPKEKGCSGGSTLVATWEDFTAWYCERGAEVVTGGALQFHNFVTLDNEMAGMEMVNVEGAYGPTGGPGIYNSTVIGYSALSPNGCRDKVTSGIVGPQRGTFSISNITFINFDSGTCSALSGCSQCRSNQGGFRSQVMALKFINADNKLRYEWEHESIWIDADGSLTGTAENVVVPSMGILPSESCTKDVQAFSVNPSVKGSVCANLQFLRFNMDGQSARPSSVVGKDLIVSNSHGTTRIPYQNMRLSNKEGWMGILYAGGTFKWEFADSEQISNFSYTAETRFLDDNDYYLVEHQFTKSPDGVSTLKNKDTVALDAIPDISTGAVHGDYYLDNTINTATYIVTKKLVEGRRKRVLFDGRSTGSMRTINFEVYRCQYEGCAASPPTIPPIVTVAPDVPVLWSDTETWKEMPVGSGGHPTEDTYGLPVEGDDIIVPEGMLLVVDTATPPLGRITVNGKIKFDDSMDHEFSANIIFIQGGTIEAGVSESEPFTHNLSIELRGSLNHTDPENEGMFLPYPTPSLGWKAMGVFGTLSLHGQLTTDSWFKLGATASAGDTQVTLVKDVDSTWINKEVMITSTGREATETEIRKVTAVDGKALTLESPLAYQHIATSLSLSESGQEVVMAGEVGLLTRNIVVKGNVYHNFENTFGGRVLVSNLSQDGVDHVGSAQLSAVEFRNMGQLGYSDSDDPRYALVFHSLGTIPEGNSYIRHCSFNTVYSAALGLFDTGNVQVEDNVFYYAVNSMIVDESSGNIYRHNLLSVNFFEGTYNGAKDDSNEKFYGAFQLTKAESVVLEKNVVSGSEQVGFKTVGEDCSTDSLWVDNEIHGGIYGVMMWVKKGRGEGGCRRVSNFLAWRVEDTAFFMQHHEDLLLSNVISVDNKLGVNQQVFEPPALKHEFVAKTATVQDSIFVGASPAYTCDFQNSASPMFNFYGSIFWEGNLEKGNTGAIFGTFTSGINVAPMFAFNNAGSYPALGGGTFFSGVTFYNFSHRDCGSDIALMTNMGSTDAIHPVFTTGLTFVDTPEDNRVFFHYANAEFVHPSDCVDMDCDGLKKVIVQDNDGSLLGSPKATLTSEAEHEWDGDPQHGVGDYRIPTSLYTDKTGALIPMDTLFPNKGIVRNSGCTYQSTWRAWKCTDITHRMLVLESLDSDTEIRRLSPIAFVADKGPDGYVDLMNGPMDYGWCAGYTCQERISTFHSVVACNYTYDVAMTSTPPQEMRLRLLHSDPSESVLLRIFFPKTQRYDVYSSATGDHIKMPTNIDSSKDSYHLFPEDDSYLPKLIDASGTNYLQREAKLLHVVIRGGDEITIKTVPQIILKFGTVLTPDEFFEDNIRQNIANFLGISPSNIRIVNIIREDSQRGHSRIGSAEHMNFEIEICSTVTETLNSTEADSSDTDLNFQQLEEAGAKFTNGFLTNSTDLPFVVDSLVVDTPVAPPAEPSPPVTKEEASKIPEGARPIAVVQKEIQDKALNESLQPKEYNQPSGIMFIGTVHTQIKTFTIFNLSISVQSDDGETLQDLGYESDPWEFTATLIGGSENASLQGPTTVPYLDGMANFQGLFVDKAGEGLSIALTLTYPDDAPTLAINLPQQFNAVDMSVTQEMTFDSGSFKYVNVPFNLTLDFMEADTEAELDPLILQGQTMTVSMQLLNNVGAALIGNTSLSLSGSAMTKINVSELTINQPGENFIIEVFTTVQPAGWTFTIKSNAFNVLPEDMAGSVTEVYLGMAKQINFVRYPERQKQYVDSILLLLDEVSTMADNATIVWEADLLKTPKDQTDFNNLIITAHGSESDLQLVHHYLCYRVCMHMMVQYTTEPIYLSKVLKLYIGDKECRPITGGCIEVRCNERLENWLGGERTMDV